MWVLEPMSVTPSAVTASNIDEDDAPVWVDQQHAKGALVLHEHYVWEALKDITSGTAAPSLDRAEDWFRREPSNRRRPFDQTNVKQATKAGSITYTVVPGVRVDTLAFLDLDAVSVRLQIVNSAGVAYDVTQGALRSENRATFYGWSFGSKEYRSKLVFAEIPTYADQTTAEFRITIEGGAGDAKVGEILFGQNWVIGTTLFETKPRILNFSRDERGAHGNSVLINRRASREITYAVKIDPTQTDYILDRFERLTATKLLFSAGKDLEEFGTTLFGTLSDLDAPVSGPKRSQISIEARGFIS